jgi:AraC-like DNA-binding protein
LRQFLIFLALITLFGVLVFFARVWDVAILSDFYRFHFVGVVFLFYWLSYKALTQPVLFGITKHQPAQVNVPSLPPADKKAAGSENANLAVYEKVRNVLERDRLYLKNDLTLTDLAVKAGFARNQVSQAINTSFKGNFFDFINDFRVEEFKRQALNPTKKHLTQVGIAMESGFNSKASFYAVFKKKTGMTPAEFVEKQSRHV